MDPATYAVARRLRVSREPAAKGRPTSKKRLAIGRKIAGIGLCLVVLVALASVAALVAGYLTMRNGISEMTLADANVKALTNGAPASQSVDMAAAHIAWAQADFHRAHDLLGPFAPVYGLLSPLPGMPGAIAAAPSLSRMADDASHGALRMVTVLQPIVAYASTVHRNTVPQVVDRLSAARVDLASACSDLQKARDDGKTVNGSAIKALGTKFVHIRSQVTGLLHSCRALVLLPGLLGDSSRKTYLFTYADEKELRAAGGFMGSNSLLTVSNGRVRQQFSGSWLDKENLTIPPPDPVRLYNREPAWLFMDSNWSPDFPTSALLERYFTRLDMGQNVDGVINITQSGVATLLDSLGPVYVPEYRRLVTGKNVGSLADYYTHRSSKPGPHHFHNADTERVQFIGIVANHIFQRLSTAGFGQLIKLGSGLQTSLSRGDARIYFTDTQAQALLHDAGLDGAVSATSTDYLYVVDTNLSYNKINGNVPIDVSYHAAVQPNGWLHSTVTLHFTNIPYLQPLRDAYGPGVGRLGGWDDYADFVRIYVPLGARIVQQSGWYQAWTPGTAYRKTMLSGYVIVRRGSSATVQVRYVVPPNVLSWSHGQTYRILVQHQAGSHPRTWHIAVTKPNGNTAAWSVTRPNKDWQHDLPISVQRMQTIPLPAPTPEIVAPGHWIEPHAFLAPPK